MEPIGRHESLLPLDSQQQPIYKFEVVISTKDIKSWRWRQGFCAIVGVIFLLQSFGIAAFSHDHEHDFSVPFVHAHEDGGGVHSHVEIVSKLVPQICVAPKTNKNFLVLSSHYAFVLLDTPIFLIVPPPEVA